MSGPSPASAIAATPRSAAAACAPLIRSLEEVSELKRSLGLLQPVCKYLKGCRRRSKGYSGDRPTHLWPRHGAARQAPWRVFTAVAKGAAAG